MNIGKLFIISAPSGTGKTTVLKRVMSNIKGLVFSISHTTRQPRNGEKNGVDYHFVDHSQFQELKDKNGFLESAKVHGNFYGTSRYAVMQQIESGLDVILDIDVQGAKIIRDLAEIEATYIFLSPPGLQELERRLRGRGLDSEETITTRLNNARKEMGAMPEYEYLVVNDKLDDAVTMFEAIVLAERSKNRRCIRGKAIGSLSYR